MFHLRGLSGFHFKNFGLGFLLLLSATGCNSDNTPTDRITDSGITDAAINLDNSPHIANDISFMDTQPPVDTQIAHKVPTEVDFVRLKEMLKTLAAEDMKGRLLGSPDGAKAEAYAIDRMTATGLQIQTQDVTLPIFDLASPIDLSIVDNKDNPAQTLEYIKQYREIKFSGSGSVNGELFFVGYGTKQSYEGIDVKGKVVAILTTPPENTTASLLDDKIHQAHLQGAIGIVFVPSGIDAQTDEYIAEQYQPAALHEYGVVDTNLLADDLPAVLIHVGVEEILLGKKTAALTKDPTPFNTNKLVHVEVHGKTYPKAVCKNVFGILPGTDPTLKDEIIGIGAHYDHIGMGGNGKPFAGAADNASGSATVLEVAMQFGQAGAAPKRTLMFALWCGEDQYIYGSVHYVKNPIFPMSKTPLYVNVDYIGDTEGPYWLREKTVAMQDEFIAASSDKPIEELNLAFACASDECPFQMKGVPFIRFLSQGPHHHSQNDTFENLTLPNIEKVAHALMRGIVKVAY